MKRNDNLFNEWIMLVIGIGLISATTEIILKDGGVMSYAFLAAVLIGIGRALFKPF